MKQLIGLWLCFITATQVTAQTLSVTATDDREPIALAASMRALAAATIAVYQDSDRETYLDNLFRLQLVAGRYREATASISALRALRENDDSPQSRASNIQYEIYAQARLEEAREGRSFTEAFRGQFRKALNKLDDRVSAMVVSMLVSEDNGGLSLILDQAALRQELHAQLERHKASPSITVIDALHLLRTYQVESSYDAFDSLTPALVMEDDGRRYSIDQNVQVKTADGATVCALIVRQRAHSERRPALLAFTIYADPLTSMTEARRSASNGYVGVAGFSRGKACSHDVPVPMEFDGTDATALIDWIARQPWSDGRVGMFGGSYNGFTQWAAAKHHPKALKALMPAVTLAPGIDVPSEGSIVQSPSYYWPFYVASGPGLDGAAFEDHARWQRMYREWYRSGRAYTDLEKIDGKPNPIWDRWVSHPDYDAYWQKMIPYKEEFATLDLPVLTTTGYYDGGQGGAIYYFQQHLKYRPTAEHYFLIGPYSHITGQRGTVDLLGDQQRDLGGYQLDPASLINMGDLRYAWFDYVFRGAPKPAILADRVNYEVMGANVWRHAATLAGMGDHKLRLYLSNARHDGGYELKTMNSAGSIHQEIDLMDRSDVDQSFSGASAAGDIKIASLDLKNRLEFISSALPEPLEISGLFSAELNFLTNKRDFDFSLQLYELLPTGKYLQLSWFLARASYVRDMSHRNLLAPGEREKLDFESARLTSRLLHRGSRLVLVLGIVKQPNHEINYGTGKDVSNETIADARSPLSVDWMASSFVEVPVRQ